jgi:Lrp/AsnC family leucine-responsive transcriptional regulator
VQKNAPHLSPCTWQTGRIIRFIPKNQRSKRRSDEDSISDATNLRLLGELQADARLSLAELGRRVGLSAPAVAERLQRLEQEEVILGYHARLNPRRLGLPLSVVVRVRPAPRQLPKVAELARRTPEVVDCRRITGEDCYILTAHVRDVDHLEEVIDQFALYGQTTTSIVQSAPVSDRGLMLEPGGSA